MSVGFTPVNQVRLTNVAYVRLQKKGKRFEIACYRNKVLNWRNKIETDIGEVLQVDTVFTHVSKGLLASSKDLIEAFGTSDQRLVCQEILDKGELQVSEQERGALYESVFRDVASIVADKTVNPENNRPYTVSMIQNAMKQIQYAVNVSKNSKSQALDVIRKLREVMPIVRANMLLRIVCLQQEVEMIREEIISVGAIVTSPDPNTSNSSSGGSGGTRAGGHSFIELRIDPELFRKIEEIVSEKTAGVGRVEVVQLRVANSHTVGTVAAPSSSSVAHQDSQQKVTTTKTTDASYNDTTSKHDKSKANSTSALKREAKAKQRANEIAKELSLLSHDAESYKNDNNNNDNNNEDDEEEYDMLREFEEESEAIGIVKSNQKNKNKKKKQIALAVLEESDDDDDDGNHSESDVHVAVPITAVATTAAAAAAAAVHEGEDQSNLPKGKVPHVNKKGKKSKRLEKEELKEREKKALALKQRIAAQNSTHSVPTAVECVAVATTKEVLESDHTPSNDDSSGAAAAAAGSTAATTTTPAVLVPEVHVSVVSGAKVQSCNTCGGQFYEVKDYRNHFRSEWHRHNLSRKMKNLPLVKSEEEFLALTLEELDL